MIIVDIIINAAVNKQSFSTNALFLLVGLVVLRESCCFRMCVKDSVKNSLREGDESLKVI